MNAAIRTKTYLSLFCLALGACSSGENAPVQTVPSIPPATTMSAIPAGTPFPLVAHVNQEYFTGSGAATGEGPGSLVKTSAGWDLTTPANRDFSRAFSFSASDGFVTPGHDGLVAPGVYSVRTGFGAAGSIYGFLALRGNAASLTYSDYGVWAVEDFLFGNTGQSPGVFTIGISTPQMPTSGTATYTGGVTVAATFVNSPQITTPNPNYYLLSFFSGDVSLTANFASNTISGVVTGLHIDPLSIPQLHHNAPATGTINDIALSGGTISGAGFSGNAAAAAATAGTTFDISGASGSFNGQFNGPNAAEAAGTFSVKSSTPCTGCAPGPTTTDITVIGSFGAHK